MDRPTSSPPNTPAAADRGDDSTQRSSPSLPPRWVVRAAWMIHRAIHRLSFGRLGLWPPSRDPSEPDTWIRRFA